MRILYAIQGTGNGHVSRAGAIIPILEQKGSVDILISGTQADVMPDYPIAYKLHGLGFIFGKKGGVDLWATYRKSKLKKFWKEIQSLPVEDYDIVINDFEPVSAWACYLKGKPCVGLSHQAAVLNPNAPKPKHADPVGLSILRYYAPVTQQYGFHFSEYDRNIYTPVIRPEVRAIIPENKGHYTVYLPAYSDKRIIKMLSRFENVTWEVFSKHTTSAYREGSIIISPVSNGRFIDSMASADGVLCGAGFETPAEALYLKKKLMVIPMKGQYEQQCNAAALKIMGVPVIKSLKQKHYSKIKRWIQSEGYIPTAFPDSTAGIIDTILENYPISSIKRQHNVSLPSAKKFKKLIAGLFLSKAAQ